MKKTKSLATIAVAAICALFASVSAGSEDRGAPVLPPEEAPEAVAAAALSLPWYSHNGGGAVGLASSNYGLNYSLSQSVTGKAASASYGMGIGFWYIVASACPIAMTGDVNVSSSITSADIIYSVNFCFKGGPAPMPCIAAGDVNCSGTVTSADIIFLVNYVFKSGPAPCDACTNSPLAASC